MPEQTESSTIELVDDNKIIKDVVDVKVIDTRKIQDQARNEVRQQESSRIKEIMSIAERFKMQPEGLKAIKDGTTLDVFREIALKKWESVSTIDTGEANLDLTHNEVKEYSFGNIIRAALEGKPEIAAYERGSVRSLHKKNE